MWKLWLLMAMAGLAPPAQGPKSRYEVKTHLRVGSAAPDFRLRSTAGEWVRLSDYRGKSTVVLVFFPAAFTPGGANQFQAYQDRLASFEEHGAKVFGISTDNLPGLTYWAGEVLKVRVPLLSDFLRAVSEAYGVLNRDTGIAVRTTFVINRDGKIDYIEQGQLPLDPAGALSACKRLRP